MTASGDRPPVIVLGGDTNALSIARQLGRAGVRVYGIGVERFAARSRYLTPLPLPPDTVPEEAWLECLLGPATEHLRGAVVLAASDVGLVLLARHREQLHDRYLLDVSDPGAQTAMLDKLATYRVAAAAGVATPHFWEIDSASDLDLHRDALVYPLVVKPLHSHAYVAAFPDGGKFQVVTGWDELVAAHRLVRDAGIAVMLVEKIPGPDDLLCSYYTYIDASGTETFDFTKRIIRRNPPNMGIASYHVTDRNAEVREVALRLFKHAGLRGVANAEFKRDLRDGQLKLIECNARFTAANGLLASAGIDLARHVYLQILGHHEPLPDRYTTGLRLLYLHNDFRAFKALRDDGELTASRWVRSLAHRQTFPYLSAHDPVPAMVFLGDTIRRVVRRVLPGRERVSSTGVRGPHRV